MSNKQLINLKHVARAFNYALGEDFYVYTKGGKTGITNEPRTECALIARRTPFAIDDVKSETLELTLTFYVKIDDKVKRDGILTQITALTGYKSFDVTADGVNYIMASYLDFEPYDAPIVDSGSFRQSVILTGTALITAADDGGVLANGNRTFMRIGEYGGKFYVPVTDVKTALRYQSDAPVTGNCDTPEVVHNAQASSIELSAILLNRDFDRSLVDMFALAENSMDVYLYVTRIIAGKEYGEKKYRLLSGGLTEPAGAFCSYGITLQEVK